MRALVSEGRTAANPRMIAAGYQRLGVTFQYLGQPDSSVWYYRQALDFYNQAGNIGLQGVMLFNIAIYFEELAEYDSSQYYLELTRQRFAEGNNPQRQGAVLFQIGKIKRQLSYPYEALEYIIAARELFEQAGDLSRMADADQEMGFAYQTLNQDRRALQYFKKAESVFLQLDDYYYATIAQLNIGTAYGTLGQPDSGRIILQQALQQCQQYEFAELELESLLNLGYLEQENNHLQRAREHYEMALARVDQAAFPRLYAQVIANYSDLIAKHYDPRRGIELAQEALRATRQTKLRAFEVTAFEALAYAYERSGQPVVALSHYRQARELKDSIYQIEAAETLAELQTQYETERKEREIAEQEAELALLAEQRSRDRLQKRSLWLGLATAVLLFVAFGYSLRQRLLRSRAEERVLRERVAGQQRELSAHTLHLVQKNQLLEQLGDQLTDLETKGQTGALGRILRSIRSEESAEQDWLHFKTYFREVHGDYEDRLRNRALTSLTPRELRLSALLKMGLSNTEIGSILNVSQESLYKAKYRLRKKLPAQEGENLDQFLQKL